ncbi:MarR family winged helix-turn-helix transcriptional regulator [uncultured Arsenicicoccus sp.]|uniref:MarR family winged helix-turn-helix transcriptional regulator n=1 Tax=uncultured Arsenicicoccus sp. TaxID=491339 RepID=UPI00259986FD|nr:MarR family transcriptional regulator [uncultured Arsenicicoccus sp.]
MNPMDRVLSHLRRSMEASQAAKNRALLDSGLTKAQYNALLLLERGHGSTATQLAAACGVSQQAMNKTVNRLVEAEFVQETPSPHGGRSRVLSITSRGLHALEIADDAVNQVEVELRRSLAPLGVDDFTAALDRLATAADHLLR